jgi:GNAT superfamily N-acetyltransferase
MAIRPATAGDLDRLMPLYRGYCDFYEMNPTDEALRSTAEAIITGPDERGFILVSEGAAGRLAGFATVSWKHSALAGSLIAYLDDLFVDPDARGQGHADDLIEACRVRAGELGAGAMAWLTAEDNHRAQKVYDRIGARHGPPFYEYELEI